MLVWDMRGSTVRNGEDGAVIVLACNFSLLFITSMTRSPQMDWLILCVVIVTSLIQILSICLTLFLSLNSRVVLPAASRPERLFSKLFVLSRLAVKSLIGRRRSSVFWWARWRYLGWRSRPTRGCQRYSSTSKRTGACSESWKNKLQKRWKDWVATAHLL